MLKKDIGPKLKSKYLVLGVGLVLLIVIMAVVIDHLDRHKSGSASNTNDTQLFNSDINSYNNEYSTQDYTSSLAILKSANAVAVTQSQKDDLDLDFGVTYFALKDYDNALKYLLLIQSGPESSPEVLGSIAGLYQKKGDNANAITYYKKAITAAQTSKNSTYKGDIPSYQQNIVTLGGTP